jgi:hypothetical protein
MPKNAEIEQLQATVSRRMIADQPNPRRDAHLERMKATFDIKKMATYVNDGFANIEKRCEAQCDTHAFVLLFCSEFEYFDAESCPRARLVRMQRTESNLTHTLSD